MPPCGYRPVAVQGIESFFADNLRYFRELYEPQEISPLEALQRERAEIESIRSGERGGRWSTVVVGLNEEFYQKLAKAAPVNWDEAMLIGEDIIKSATQELNSL